MFSSKILIHLCTIKLRRRRKHSCRYCLQAILSSSFDSLVKKLGEDDFKYLSQEFDSKVLSL